MIDNQELKKLIIGLSSVEAKKVISKKTGLKKSATRDLYLKLNEDWGEEIENIDNDITYNKKSDCYILFLKKIGKNIVLRGEVYRDIVRCYSDLLGEPSTIEDLSRIHAIPRHLLTEILKICGLNHSILPISDEELKEKGVEEIAEDILELKKFKVIQTFNKKDWNETRINANKWLEFQEGTFKPFTNWLEKWQSPTYKPYRPIDNKNKTLSMITVLSDLHYGAHANKEDLVRGEDTNTPSTVAAVKSYYEKILDDIKNHKFDIETLVILSNGDILHTANPFGTTSKGTPLRYDLLSEAQFDAAFNSLTEFIYQLSRAVPKTIIHSLKGNHFGTGDSILFKCLAAYFKDQKNIEFHIHHAHSACFRERNLFCVASHGANDSVKAKITGNKVQSFVQSLIINNQLNMEGITSRAAFFADLHHSSTKEFSDFEYILCPSLVKGDNYADALGLYSKSRQQAFIVDDYGIKATLNYLF